MWKIKDRLKKLSYSELMLKALCTFTLLIYLYCVLNITLIDRTPGMRRHVFRPLWEVSVMLKSGDYSYWSGQIGGNLVMLLPLGFMLPIMSEKFRSIKAAAVIGFAFSIFIEFAQYYTGRGLFESDDILHNTIGACIGCIIYVIISNRLPDKVTETDQ
ncbi:MULTISPECIES: VanZ family protein [Ruminococcus]|uniref:VanZ like family protein n=1 Tax=Ruminococcus flavefaciens TaxID=1265 RepID=A0A1M7J5M5_RUMFL|nr:MULTISPECIES: VanZ family protein [Ruminococcus]MCR4796193.1 VanZ family protein [Ruminococcus sp.]SHM48232.1 VanZ like family protein [Ruminococcus flavefaciens]